MFSVAYVNGRYVSYDYAQVPVEDRGYQFADGIYEVVLMINRRLLDGDLHFARLQRSLGELEISMPMPMPALKSVVQELMDRTPRQHGSLYVQVTRGVATRDHPYPKAVRPSLVAYFMKAKFPKTTEVNDGTEVVTMPDIRWGRCDVKTIALLPNVMAKQESLRANAREALMVRPDGNVTEGSSTNFFIVNEEGQIITHQADNRILPGVTRHVVLEMARGLQIPVIERPFTASELGQAKEVFFTSTSVGVMPVVKVDGKTVGEGKPGAVSRKLMEHYRTHTEQQCGILPF